VDGSGMLVLLNDKGETRYIRTGSFEVSNEGFVVLGGTDWRLATLDSGGRAVAVSVDATQTSTPVETTRIAFANNLSSTATSHSVSNVNVYDENGVQHVWQIAFSREEGSLDWKVKVTDDKAKVIGEKVLTMANGKPNQATSKLTFADADNGLSVEFDFSSGVTSFSSGTLSTLRASAVDGHGTGTVTTVAVNADGALELTFSNDQKVQLGAVALASFRNPEDLLQEASGLFASDGSTDVELLSSADPRVGGVRSRRLEASNVDLSREFGDMILIQRGYQASSQIISVSNDMIQQLFTIRGQG